MVSSYHSFPSIHLLVSHIKSLANTTASIPTPATTVTVLAGCFLAADEEPEMNSPVELSWALVVVEVVVVEDDEDGVGGGAEEQPPAVH